MIFLVETDARHVLGVRIAENLTSQDVEIAMNFLKKKVRTQDHIAFYAEMDDLRDIDRGAVLKELKYLFEQVMELAHIDRVALVLDDDEADGERIKALGFVTDIRTYAPSKKEEAKAWVAQPLMQA